MDLELASAPGRYLLQLSDRWLLVALAPVPGVIVLGLFLDDALVEVVDDPPDVLGYFRAYPALGERLRGSVPTLTPGERRRG